MILIWKFHGLVVIYFMFQYITHFVLWLKAESDVDEVEGSYQIVDLNESDLDFEVLTFMNSNEKTEKLFLDYWDHLQGR